MHNQTHSFLTENPNEDVAGVILSKAASCRAGQEPPSCLLVSCTLPRLQSCCIAPWVIPGKFPLQQAFCTWMLPSFWSSASLLLLPAKSPQITGSLIVKTHLPGKQQFLRHITTGLSLTAIFKSFAGLLRVWELHSPFVRLLTPPPKEEPCRTDRTSAAGLRTRFQP